MDEKKENEEVKEEVKVEVNKPEEKKEEPKKKAENKEDAKAKKEEKVDKEDKKVEKPVEATKKEEKKVEKPVAEAKKEEPKFKNTTTSKETKTKDSKNNGLWVLAIILIVVLVAIIALLAFRQKSAKETVEAMLNCLKTGDFNSIETYTNYNDLINSIDLDDESRTMNEEAQRLLFNKLSWKIGEVKEEQDTATVEVEITNKNFETVLSNYMQKVVKIAFSGTEPTEEEYNNYLLEELRKEDIPTTTVSKTIEVKKVDGKWVVTANNELVTLLLPGLESLINTSSNS